MERGERGGRSCGQFNFGAKRCTVFDTEASDGDCEADYAPAPSLRCKCEGCLYTEGAGTERRRAGAPQRLLLVHENKDETSFTSTPFLAVEVVSKRAAKSKMETTHVCVVNLVGENGMGERECKFKIIGNAPRNRCRRNSTIH